MKWEFAFILVLFILPRIKSQVCIFISACEPLKFSSVFISASFKSSQRRVLGYIYSNVKKIVDHQQIVFDTLWNRAIPAEQKIKELVEGIVFRIFRGYYWSWTLLYIILITYYNDRRKKQKQWIYEFNSGNSNSIDADDYGLSRGTE